MQRFFKNGLIVMVTYPGGKTLKSFKSGLIVMGDLPRWKEYEN
jgi:hypothetical protein